MSKPSPNRLIVGVFSLFVLSYYSSAWAVSDSYGTEIIPGESRVKTTGVFKCYTGTVQSISGSQARLRLPSGDLVEVPLGDCKVIMGQISEGLNSNSPNVATRTSKNTEIQIGAIEPHLDNTNRAGGVE
jgi:hypothetical protein